MELGQKVIKGLKIGAMFRLAAQIFTWLNTLILIRLLTPDDYGLMAMAMAFIGIFALVGDFGIAKAIIQAKELSDETLKQAFTVNIISSLIFFLAFFLAAPYIAEFFNEPRVTLLVQAVACQHLIMIFHTLPYALSSISIGRLMSKTDLGVFSVAGNLANLPSSKIGELLNHLGLSSFAKLQNEKEVAGLYLLKSTQLASLALFPMYLGMCATAPELIPLVLSEKWAIAIVPFQILCLANPVHMLAEILSTATTAVGVPQKNTRVLLGSILCLPLVLVGIQYGITGACLTLLGVALLSFVLHIKTMLPVFQVRFHDYFAAFLPGLVSAGVMLAGLEFLRIELAEQMHSWMFLLLTILAGGIIYVLMLLIFFRTVLIRVKGYLRH